MERNDSIIVGLAIGAVVPILGFWVTQQIFELLVSQGIMPPASDDIQSSRMRTIAILAICFNLIPFNYAKRKRLDNILRGIVFPTLIYVGYWVWTYKSIIGL